MRYEQDGLVLGGSADGFVEEVGADVGVDRTEGVVQQQKGPVAVQGACQTHPLTLASAQIGTPLSYLERQQGHIYIRTSHWAHTKEALERDSGLVKLNMVSGCN